MMRSVGHDPVDQVIHARDVVDEFGAGGDQESNRGRRTAGSGCPEQEKQPVLEHVLAAERIGEPAGRHEQRGVDDGVRVQTQASSAAVLWGNPFRRAPKAANNTVPSMETRNITMLATKNAGQGDAADGAWGAAWVRRSVRSPVECSVDLDAQWCC